MTIEDRNDLITNNIGFANRIAWKQFSKTPPCVQYEELQSAAYMGLVDAAQKYDGSKPFQIYASYRIFGEMRDYLRTLKWGGRNLDIKMDKITSEQIGVSLNFLSETFDHICKDIDSRAKEIIAFYYLEGLTLSDIASKIGLSLTRVHQILKTNIKFIRSTQKVA